MTELNLLALACVAKLDANMIADTPIATFAGGHIVLGCDEFAIMFNTIGGFFVTIVAGTVVVESIALNDGNEPRPVVRARHDELERRSRQLFGDDIERLDPLGLRGGKRAVAS